LDPISQLIRSLIGTQTYDEVSDRAFSALQKGLYPWEAILRAPDRILLHYIEPVTYAKAKAPQLRGAMQMIERSVGAICLDFLNDQSVEDAQGWLRKLPGFDVKVSAAVLNFSTLRKRVLVVDTHYFRVAKRLELLRPKTRFPAAQRVLMNQHVPSHWTAEDLAEHFGLIKCHGQNVCRHRGPLCHRCVLRDVCPTGSRT
jgi:endonuclease-3